MNQRATLIAVSIFGFLAVALGAFGAHLLKPMLSETGRAETFELAVRYQFYHTLALLGTGILMAKLPGLKSSALFLSLGIFIFSGSLYTLALTNQPMWGAVTPVGGVLLILGWISFGWTVYKTVLERPL